MKTTMYRNLILFLSLAVLAACSPGARYDRMLKRELASGVRQDSLFMGLYLGMTDKDFYTRCWKLNKEGLVKQGTNNTSVEYQTLDELSHPATMNFYPRFCDGKITTMPVRFIYNGWAPKEQGTSGGATEPGCAAVVQISVQGRFLEVEHPHPRQSPGPGRRQPPYPTLMVRNDRYVWAIFTDLLADTSSSAAVIPNVEETE
ncbi:MAG: hypothetical protein R2751_11820 [Bacteroidales bacterium]